MPNLSDSVGAVSQTVRSGNVLRFPERTVLDCQKAMCFSLFLFGVSRPYGFTNRTFRKTYGRDGGFPERTVSENRSDGMALPAHGAGAKVPRQ